MNIDKELYAEMRRAILGMKLVINALDKDGGFVELLTPLSQKAIGRLDMVADKLMRSNQ